MGFWCRKLSLILEIIVLIWFLFHVTILLLWHLPLMQIATKGATSMLVKPLADHSRQTSEEGGVWDYNSWSLAVAIERLWLLGDLRAGPGQSETSHTLPCPGDVPSTCIPHSQKLPQAKPWGSDGFRAHLGSIHAWIQLGPLYKLLRFGRWVEIYLSCGHSRPVSCVIPLLIKLGTYQSGVAWIFLQSCPAVHVQKLVSLYLESSKPTRFTQNMKIMIVICITEH